MDRDAETIEEHEVASREEALTLFGSLQQQRAVAWIECGDFQDVQQLEDELTAVQRGKGICLFLNIPPDYEFMDLVQSTLPQVLDETLRWIENQKVHIVRFKAA